MQVLLVGLVDSAVGDAVGAITTRFDIGFEKLTPGRMVDGLRRFGIMGLPFWPKIGVGGK